MRIGSWDLPNMGDSIGDSIVTPYITNFLGKDPNRCQMTRMFCWPSTFVVSFYLFVDEASERKVSTFLIIFRNSFQLSFVSRNNYIFSPRLSPR